MGEGLRGENTQFHELSLEGAETCLEDLNVSCRFSPGIDYIEKDNTIMTNEKGIPLVRVKAGMFADGKIPLSVFRAAEILREEFGIMIDVDVENPSLTLHSGFGGIFGADAVIDLFGVEKIIVVREELETLSEEELINRIIFKILKNIGRKNIKDDEGQNIPFRNQEPPRLASAALRSREASVLIYY